jgi:hypothetical protein
VTDGTDLVPELGRARTRRYCGIRLMSVPRLCQLGISDGYPFDDLSGARTTPTSLVTPAR